MYSKIAHITKQDDVTVLTFTIVTYTAYGIFVDGYLEENRGLKLGMDLVFRN